jgi:prolactin regulatory element-binding protein
MDNKAIVEQVLAMPKVVGISLDSWNVEHVVQLSLDVAVLVMKQTVSSSKETNAVLVASLVSDVLEQLKSKALSSVAPEKSIAVSQHFDVLKGFASGGLPVVFSYLPHLNIPFRFRDCFSFCMRVSSAVSPDELVKVPEVKVDEVKVDEVKVAEVKVDEVKVADVKVADVKVADVKVDEVKVPEVKVPEVKVAEAKVAEVKVSEKKVQKGENQPSKRV